MEQTKYDVFISYRRVGGKEYARTLKPELEKRGYKVFLDFDELDDGVFDQRIKDAISDSSVFLIILSKGALDRCVNKGDWVREEILHAQKCHCHILPVEFDKSFREIPENTPDELSSIIGSHSWAQVDTEALLKESVDKMVKKNIDPYVKHEEVKTGVEIHIDVDVNCDLFRFKAFITHLKAGEDNVVYFKPGKYKLEFVSMEFPEVKESKVYDIAVGIECDFMEVSLKDRVKALQEAAGEAKRKAEEEARQEAAREKARQAIEEKRKIVQEAFYKWRVEHNLEEEQQKKLKAVETLELAPICKDGKYGFINKTGKVVIPCQWEYAKPFSGGIAEVTDKYNQVWLINTIGEIVSLRTPLRTEDEVLTEGLIPFQIEGLYGYIDKMGKVVIPCQWKFAKPFSNGLAKVTDKYEQIWKIDKTGKVVGKV